MTDPQPGEPAFADLLDDLLDDLLCGREPDLAAAAERHASVAHRIDEALRLAGGVAGRRTPVRPVLRDYEIVRELGRGGMGTVYLARQKDLQREVALKVLPHSFGLSPSSRQRFLGEARSLARVAHEHVVDIHRIVDDGDLLAFEMEYVDGPSLQVVLDHLRAHRERTGSSPGLAAVAELLGPTARLEARNLTQWFVRIAQKVGRALGAVHQNGLVHRDVKPANVLLRQNGEPVLVDFGLVHLTGLAATRVGAFVGTPVYSPPEQLRGDTIGPPADVYGLAATLYECLTLATPFRGATTTDLLRRIESGRFQPLRRQVPGAPRDLETILVHAMEVDPTRRYRDGAEFADDLQRLLELHPIQARPVGLARRCGKFLRRNRNLLLAGCVGAVLVALGTWPLFDQVQARAHHRDEARGLVRSARLELIASGHGQNRAVAAAAGPRALADALAAYERATELDPEDAAAARERDVVRLAIWLRQLSVRDQVALPRELEGPRFRELCAPLGACTVAAARRLASGTLGVDAEPLDVTAAEADDRVSLGLLAFLFGDAKLCEQAWGSVPPERADQPLPDAGLGLLLLADGAPEQAYVHLLQAQRSFPESTTLVLELADAALALGDLALARHWLERVDAAAASTPFCRRIALDLRAATEPDDDLAAAYEQLAVDDPADPTPRQRVAWLAMRRGDLAGAAGHLDALIRDWPDVASFRRDRARLALQRRELGAYLQQALAAAVREYGRGRSRGTIGDLLEIPRLGGLVDTWRAGIATTGDVCCGLGLSGGELPARAFAAPRLVAAAERLLPVVAAAVRAGLRRADLDPHLLGGRGDVFTVLPELIARLPVLVGVERPWSRAALAALPVVVAALRPVALVLVAPLRLALADEELVATRTLTIEPDRPVEWPLAFGNALLRVGDCNGDGLDDVLVGCMSLRPAEQCGRVLVVDGRTGATIGAWSSDDREHMFGHSLARVGDLDGDGVGDVLIGAPAGTPATRSGHVEIWSSKAGAMRWRLVGEGPGFGAGVVGLGDLDGDGVDDFAVATAPLLRNSAAQGAVQIYSGRQRMLLRTFANDQPGVWYGASIAAAGDADGDGAVDLVVGGNYGGAPGFVRLYSARTGAVLQTWREANEQACFGAFVLGVGDVDGDGAADVLVTATRLESGAGRDQVFVYSGANGRCLATMTGSAEGIAFGHSVAAYVGPRGRLLAIGAPLAGVHGAGAIEFWQIGHGRVASVQATGVETHVGGCLAATSDLDGDGWPELFCGPSQRWHGAVLRIDSAAIDLPR